MNTSDTVTIPLGALMQAMMTSMQSQPQLQPIGGPLNVLHGHTSQVVQQQAAFPTFFLQAPQLQTIPGPLSMSQPGGQPWVLQPTLQTVQAHTPQPPSGPSSSPAAQTRPFVNEHTVRVANSMKSMPQGMVRGGSLPVGFAPDDERVLVDALRNAKAEGLTPLQGFSKLINVNNHTTAGQLKRMFLELDPYPNLTSNAAAWKDYFLTHVERIGPKIYPQAYAGTPASSPSLSMSKADGSRSTSTSGGSQQTCNESTSASYRSRRGAPVEEYHEEVRIPFLPPGTKPKAPRRDPRDNSPKFTKEEKIFFIHYLKYRLRKGPVPSKEQLYNELAKQTPHHTAGSWKRHWDKACKLPNEIYIQARKRVHSDLQRSRAASHPAESSDKEDDSREEQDPSSDAEYEPTASQTPSSTTRKGKKRNSVRKYKVTEEDVQAMVQYVMDKRSCGEGWEPLSSVSPWEEFAARPENRTRHARAWAQIAYKRGKVISAYVRQYETEQVPSTEEEISEPPVAATSVDPRPRMEKERVEETKGPGKRHLQNEQEHGSEEDTMSSIQKRPRLDESTEIAFLH